MTDPEWVRLRTAYHTDVGEDGTDAETEMTEGATVRELENADTPNSGLNSGMENKSEIETLDGVSGSESDVSQAIPLEVNFLANASESETAERIVENISEVNHDSEVNKIQEPRTVVEVVDAIINDDSEEFVDASSEMPGPQIDTNAVIMTEISDNLEDILPDVPSSPIEVPEIEDDINATDTQQQGTLRSTRLARMRSNSASETLEDNTNGDENASEDEQVHPLSDSSSVDETRGSETQENRLSQIGDIISSALGGIPEISIHSYSSGSSNDSEVVVIEEVVEEQGVNVAEKKTGRRNRRCWRIWEVMAQFAVCLYIHIQETIRKAVPTSKMSLMQAWTFSAFATGTTPYYLGYTEDNQKFELKSLALQKVFCFVQHAFATAEAISSVHNISLILTGTISPYTFIQIGGVIASCICSFMFTKACFYDMNNIVEYENAADGSQTPRNLESIPVRSSSRENAAPKRSFGMALSFLLGFLTFLGFMIASSTITQLHDFDDDWENGGPAAVVQTYACHARQTYQWKNDTNCDLDYFAEKISELPKEEILWGVIGMLSSFSSRLAEYQRHIAIHSFNIAFFMDSWQAETATLQFHAPLIQVYDRLYTRTKHLSGFGGLLLLSELGEIAFRLPSWSSVILRSDIIRRLRMALLLLAFVTSTSLGCVATWKSEMIRKEMSGPRGHTSLPSTAKATAIFFLHLYQHPIGLGIFGLVTVNFAFMAGYMSTVGSFVMMLYEVERNNCVKAE